MRLVLEALLKSAGIPKLDFFLRGTLKLRDQSGV